MPDLPFRRLGRVLDLCQELRLHPDAPVSDPLRVRLRLADQRFQSLLQVGRGRLIEPVVNLAGIDEVVTLAAAEIDAVPFAFVERETGDGQGLPLRACLLDPVVRCVIPDGRP